MDLEVTVRGLVKEACRLADTADDSDSIGALASVLHAALVIGQSDSSAYNLDNAFLKGREAAAWQQIFLYLRQLDAVRQHRDASNQTDSVRAAFFWLSFEPWAAVLLSAASCLPPRAQQQHQSQPMGPGSKLARLIAALMQLAPASVLLQSMVSHLSLVTPLADAYEGGPGGPGPGAGSGRRGRSRSGASARVTSRGAELAAAFLAQRFAPFGSGSSSGSGVSELLLHLAVHRALSHGSVRQRQLREGDVAAKWRSEPAPQYQGNIERDQMEAAQDPDSDRDSQDTSCCYGQGGIVLSATDEMALRHLLLLQPSQNHSSSLLSPSGANAGMSDPALLAGLLVSVPDRAAGLLATCTTGPGWLLKDASLDMLQPEVFYWRLLQHLMDAIADPHRTVMAALSQLRKSLNECTAPLTSMDIGAGPGGKGPVAEAVNYSGADSSRGGDGGGEATVSAAAVMSLEPFVTSAAIELLSEILERLAKRGHVATAADALLACTAGLRAMYDTSVDVITNESGGGSRGSSADSGHQHRLQGGCTTALLQLADTNSVALQRMLVALVDRAAVAALALTVAAPRSPAAAPVNGTGCRGQEGNSPPPPSPAHQDNLQRLQQREMLLGLSPPLPPSALATALSSLSWLLPPNVAAHSAVSYILTDRMLLSLQLPLHSLQLLTALLPAVYPDTYPVSTATMLAAAWGDAAAVTRTSVQRQAYLTQALLHVLAQLDRDTLEGTPGLLGWLLAGVSHRLGSPLVATQRQAMRAGRGFSLVLDSSSDLFADMGDLGLAPDELWPGALPRQVQWRPAAQVPAPNNTVQDTSAPAAASGGGKGTAPAVDADSKRDDDGDAEGEGEGDVGRGDSGSVCTATDSDDEDVEGEEEDEDEEELRPLGSVEEMEGDPEADSWMRAEPSSLQLRALAAALRKQDDVNVVLAALKRLEEVIRAAPDELGLVAPELVRSLLHCRVPEWAEGVPLEQQHQEGPGVLQGASGRPVTAAVRGSLSSSSALDQRRRSLVALLTMAPLPAGDALVPEVYSPHLDLHQRLTLLDALTTAAAELSDPRTAPQLTQGPGGRPLLQRSSISQVPPVMHRHQLPGAERHEHSAWEGNAASTSTSGSGSVHRVSGSGKAVLRALSDSQDNVSDSVGARGGGRMQQGVASRGPRTRVWAPAALRKLKEEEAAAARGQPGPGAATFRNRFADVALRWAAGLLREVDKVKHGVDLLHRDHQLLGRLLTTLAAFAEAAAGSTAVPPLASATLELIRAPQVHGHPEPYVRRAALLATGQVLAQLPPASVAGALLGAGASGGHGGMGGSGAGGSSGGGGGLAERLQWVSGWCRSVEDEDVDPHCRLMAQACVNLQADLASRCLASLQDTAAAAAPLTPTLPSLDLARTARLLAASPTPSLAGNSRVSGGDLGRGTAAASFVRDVGAW